MSELSELINRKAVEAAAAKMSKIARKRAEVVAEKYVIEFIKSGKLDALVKANMKRGLKSLSRDGDVWDNLDRKQNRKLWDKVIARAFK